MYSKEMESKKELEGVLRGCIEDVRDEIQRKKNETALIYKQHHHNIVMAKLGNRERKVETDVEMVSEKERILEVLLSQERVLTLLYDKTFPPKKDSKAA